MPVASTVFKRRFIVSSPLVVSFLAPSLADGADIFLHHCDYDRRQNNCTGPNSFCHIQCALSCRDIYGVSKRACAAKARKETAHRTMAGAVESTLSVRNVALTRMAQRWRR